MTKVFLEVEFDLETHYRRETPPKINPPPGEPGEAEEIEIISIDTVTVGEDAVIRLPADVSEILLEELLANDKIREQFEEQVRRDALDG